MGRLLWAIGALLAVGLPVAGWIGIYVHHGSLGLGSLTALAGAAAVGWWGSGPGRTRTLGWALLGLGGVAWGAVGWAGWQWWLHEQALRNLETMKAHWRALASYREVEGAYPEDLAAALDRSSPPEGVSGVDAWGRALHYRRVGEGFVLVSLGRDGEPDGPDYRIDRDAGAHVRTCGDWSADQVLSETGFHRSCGK